MLLFSYAFLLSAVMAQFLPLNFNSTAMAVDASCLAGIETMSACLNDTVKMNSYINSLTTMMMTDSALLNCVMAISKASASAPNSTSLMAPGGMLD
jgi:hypothetical protein